MSPSDLEKLERLSGPVEHRAAVALEALPALIAEVKKLREALYGLYGLVESGWLVRDTTNDSDGNWARNQIEPVLKLKKASDALKEKP